MKCLVFLLISLALAMSFPQPRDNPTPPGTPPPPPDHGPEELENRMAGMSISLLLFGIFESETVFTWL